MADIDLLIQLGNLEQYPKDHMVFFQDDPGDRMYIVLKGEFGVFINSFTDFPIRIAGVREGSFFGEMSVVDDWPRSATVVSETDGGTALVIKKDNFSELLDKDPDIAANIMETLRNRAVSTADRVRAAGKPVPDLPTYLKTATASESNSRVNYFKMLARRIREMNDLLVGLSGAAQAPPPSPATATQETQSQGLVRLLPAGYAALNRDDTNDNAAMLQQKRFSCPFCSMDVDAFVPQFSALVQEKVMLDGRVIYKDFDILRYTNIVCPHCNYTDTYQEFGRRGATSTHTASAAILFRNAEGFSGFALTHSHTADEAVLSYYLNLHCLSLTSGDPLRFAKAWMRLYWIYGDCGNYPFARQAAGYARGYYAQYIQDNGGLMAGEDKTRLLGILGELSAVLEDYTLAGEYYRLCVEMSREYNNDLLDECIRRLQEVEGMKK